VLIVCDTLRADHLGCYGCPLPTSPAIDRLAAEGARFTQARSPHIPTQPAHTTLFAGQDAFVHHVVAHGGPVLPPAGLWWLPEALSGAGVVTAAADNLGRWFPRGFDRYCPYALEPSPDGFWRKSEAVLAAAAEAVDTLGAAARAGRPFFGFFHFWDAHTPYCPPPPWHRLFYAGDEKRAGEHGLDAMWAFAPFADYFAGWMPGVTDRAFPRAQYAACVRALDHGVGRLLRLLGAAGCLQDAIVLLTADHGEELGEHGIWFDHHGLYETNLRVPLLLWGPGRVPRGVACGGPVTLLDVAPTVLGALGVPAPAFLPGRDLGMAWRGGLGSEDPLYCTECSWMRKRAWLDGRYKLISALEPDFHGGPDVELYDMVADPGETANLAAVRPEVASALLRRLEDHVARRARETGDGDPLARQTVSLRRIVAPGAPAPPAVSEEDRERVSRRLANLGY
jgi:arylsulfatase A-like enzyme